MTTPRPRARRGEGERLREEILAAAERLLVQTGDEEAVSIRAIADAVGVTPPSIYLHFADKDALLRAVCQRLFQALDAFIEEQAVSADPLDSLRRRGHAYIRFGLDNPEPYRILFMSKPGHGHAGAPAFDPTDAAALEHLIQGIARCIDAGVLRPVDPRNAAIGLWAGVHGLTSLLISLRGFPWPPEGELIDSMLSTLIDGLAARPAAPAAGSWHPHRGGA